MKRTPGTLEEIRIAEPCNASWEQMQGDEKVRFCGECRKNVYNLSAMTREEADGWVHELEGRLCVRFYQRRDGTVLTSNCPVGVRKARLWLSARLAGIAAAFAGMFVFGSKSAPAKMGDIATPTTPFVVLNNEPKDDTPVVMGSPAPIPQVTMGMVALPKARMGRVSPHSQPFEKNAELRRVITSVPPPPRSGKR